MIDYFLLRNPWRNNSDLTNKQTVGVVITNIIMLTIWVAIWVFAIKRAIKCSDAKPDSRALHLLFATVSPVLYLIFSHSVSGFC